MTGGGWYQAGTTTGTTFTDNSEIADWGRFGIEYNYYVKAENAGGLSPASNIVEVWLEGEVDPDKAAGIGAAKLPEKLHLAQNYPNPFNPVTKINFQLPESGPVKITVYDVTGKEVISLVNTVLPAGYH
jgi:hypothetical protein